ncbi:MAG: isoaspartyl peptidase/L-asparaginase, partial [Pseudomonadota bacterium]
MRRGFCVWALSVAVLAAGGMAACAQDPALTTEGESKVAWRHGIHGGAGVILKDNITDEQEAAYHAALNEALEAGAEVLRNGGSALDAVEASIIPMENNPLFNAGRGAVFTAAGEHELDASIMDGRTRDAGAVAGVRTVKNPVLAARAVMEASPHVMFAGKGADDFAAAQGVEQVENSYFDTDFRAEALERVLETQRRTSADNAGTVGAVAIDENGNLAAAT